MKTLAWLLCTLSVATVCQAQDDRLDPSQQTTILRYAGPTITPPVPVAVLNTKFPNATLAADWLAGQRKQKMLSYSFSPEKENFVGKTQGGLDSLFSQADRNNAFLFFDDCDVLFGKASLSEEEKAVTQQFFRLSRKYKGGVLAQCTGEPAYFALAKGGFGIVSLNVGD